MVNKIEESKGLMWFIKNQPIEIDFNIKHGFHKETTFYCGELMYNELVKLGINLS